MRLPSLKLGSKKISCADKKLMEIFLFYHVINDDLIQIKKVSLFSDNLSLSTMKEGNEEEESCDEEKGGGENNDRRLFDSRCRKISWKAMSLT